MDTILEKCNLPKLTQGKNFFKLNKPISIELIESVGKESSSLRKTPVETSFF